MFVYKKLKASDVNVLASEAHKEFTITNNNTSSLGVSFINAHYSSGSKDSYSQFNLNNELEYFQLDHLFYKDHIFNIGSLNGGINYINQEKYLYQNVPILSIPQGIFGSSIQRGTFKFSDQHLPNNTTSYSGNRVYVDDSKGNIYRTYPYSSIDIIFGPDAFKPQKEKVLHIGPVKGFKHTDLTKDPNTGDTLVNPPSSYNSIELDDSLYSNTIEYISCSFNHLSGKNLTSIQLENGYVKVPHNNNINFNQEDFSIAFFYKSTNTDSKYLLAKSKSQTVIATPESNTDGSLKNTHGSSSYLQPIESDAGNRYPFEITLDGSTNKINFSRSDGNITTNITSSTAISPNTLYHIICVKDEGNIKIYVNGSIDTPVDIVDNTTLCANSADLFIGVNPDISQNKLDNTSEGEISQIIIFNTAMDNESVNLAGSTFPDTIHNGSSVVGNIFYEQGIVTFTSPSLINAFTNTTSYSENILLNPTQYDISGGDLADTIDLTFSGSLTFFNEEQLLNASNSSIFNNLNFSLSSISSSESGGNIELISFPTQVVENAFSGISLSSISSQSILEYANDYSELSSIISAIPGGVGNNPGELGVDSDSSSSLNSILGVYLGVSLAENQTVTESMDILFISNSQDILADDFTSDNIISDTPFELGSLGPYGGKDGEYASTIPAGFYFKAPNTDSAYYTGSATQTSATTFTTENEIDFKYNAVNNSTPIGVTRGATYNKSTGVFNVPPGFIEIDEAPNGLTFRYDITFGGTFSPNFGEDYNLKVRLYKNGSDTGEVNTLTSGFFGSTITDTLDYGPNFDPFQTISNGDKFSLTIQLYGDDITFPSDNITFQVNNFSITFPEVDNDDTLGNKLKIQDTISTELNSTYNINLTDINPNQEAFYDHSNIIGLNQDINFNTLGVKVLLWQKTTIPNIPSNYVLVTSSFYPSSSNSYTNNDFSYQHTTNETYPQDLYLIILADTAENIISSPQSSLSGIIPVSVPENSAFSILGEYRINEASGSNIIELNSSISNQFTSSTNVSSTIIFGDTTEFIGSSTPNPVDILGFVGNDPTKVLVDGYYFATSSFSATASLDRGNFISGSASIDIPGTKGIYEITNVNIGSNTNAFTGLPESISSTQKVRLQSKLNGTLLDTKYVNGGQPISNLFQNNPLNLGVLDNTDNVSFEFTVVDNSNNLDTVTKDQGFYISRIRLNKITSSNELSTNDGSDFPDVDTILFESPHSGIGYASMPLSTGVINTSILSINGDTATLGENYFITSSVGVVEGGEITGSINGPFLISASYDFNYTTGKEYYFDFTGDISQINDGGTGEGVGIRVLDEDNSIISEVYNESGTTTLGPSNLDIDYKRFSSNGTGKILLFVSGNSSNLYPNGIVTSSNNNFTGSYGIGFTITARSGSYTSSGVTFSDFEFTEGSSDSNLLRITSSHTTGGTLEPILTTGNSIYNIVTRSAEGNIELTQPLFITGSSPSTGSHPTQSLVGISISPLPTNPLNTNSEVNDNMLGSIISYTDPNTGTVQNVQITSLEPDPLLGGNSVELNNGFGTFQVGTFDNQQPQGVDVNYSITSAVPFTASFKNTHLIFENEFQCTVEEDEFNFTLNPTARKQQSIHKGDLADFATGSNFRPYVTTIGLYNEENELLVVGKLGQPIKMSNETDTTFIVRYDT